MTDFHSEPFDEATLQKLAIFEKYLTSWLPVFINEDQDVDWNRQINIFDFFCGPGQDVDGNRGSPLIAIDACRKYENQLVDQGRTVNLHFNDTSAKKIDILRQRVKEEMPHPRIEVNYSNQSFQECFSASKRTMAGCSNLLFIDQCGIKEVTPEVFKELISIKGTDFLFFIASSFVRRFHSHPDFKKFLDAGDRATAGSSSDSHRNIADYYRSLIPKNKKYYLGSFSLKKGRNVNGLIFGSANLKGIAKFLGVVWEIDSQHGEANFDIDNDRLPVSGESLRLFESNDVTKKVQMFQQELKKLVLGGRFETDARVYTYSLQEGFIPTKHAKPVLMELRKSGLIQTAGNPRLGEACLKEPRHITVTTRQE